MEKHILKRKIDSGFEKERQLLEHEVGTGLKLPILSYVRPVFFTILLTVTLIALIINVVISLKFYIK